MISTDDVSSGSTSRTACTIAIRKTKAHYARSQCSQIASHGRCRCGAASARKGGRPIPRAGMQGRRRPVDPGALRAGNPPRTAKGPLPGPLSARKAPRAGATTPPPADFLRSTPGDGGLSCRVRDGTGRSPPPWSRPRGALAPRALRTPSGRPGGRMAHGREEPPRPPGLAARRMARARAISTARLNASRRLQLRPIDQMVYLGPYRRENSSRRRLPA